MSVNTSPISESELQLLQALVYREFGMHFDERRMHILEDRVQKRLRECQIDTAYNYYQFVISEDGKGELSELVQLLTVHETSFFRNRPQLDFFQREILDQVLLRKRELQDFTLRIWSAGCSTGQEPYTLAMLVCDALNYFNMRYPVAGAPQPEPGTAKPLIPAPWRLEIIASDVSYTALRVGQQGSYSHAQMEPVDYCYRLRFFDRLGDSYVAKPVVKQFIHFDFHNLKAEFLPLGNDVIFCRNVMIYFDEAEQRRLVDKLHKCLRPSGYLFVGHAESLLGLTPKFRLLHSDNSTAYQRVDEEEQP